MFKKTITYFGILRSITSWAKVSRELILSLLAQGVDINIYERKGFLYDQAFVLDNAIKAKISHQFKGDIIFTFEHPRTYGYLPRQSFKLGFLVYEFTILPEFWVGQINRYLDYVIVPSRFCEKVFIKSGVIRNKVKVLRHGFNPLYYYPSRRKPSGGADFTFLCVANPHKREGLELLLKSFSQAFTGRDKVKLMLKLSYMPQAAPKPFEYDCLSGVFNSSVRRANSPAIEVTDVKLAEKAMGDLYRKSDCYFSLTKAEGFGLCFLEALACGLPLAGVSWGGGTDFLNKQNTYFVKHTLKPAGDEVYEKIDSAGFIAQPDINHASEVMRDIYRRWKDGRAQKRRFLNNPEYFWWDSVAWDFLALLSSI